MRLAGISTRPSKNVFTNTSPDSDPEFKDKAKYIKLVENLQNKVSVSCINEEGNQIIEIQSLQIK